jgi:hypothetical protein
MARNLVCSDCNEMMKIGFIPDLTYGGLVRLAWVEGKPEKNQWSSFWNNFWKRKNYYILAYRCEQCGALKLFTEPGQAAFE